jgi:hypothetical protein
MKKIKTVLFLLSLFVLTFVFYSCSTDDDDEALSISERIVRFCDDYNNNRNSIKNNFTAGSLANSDMAYWNTFFGGSASNHEKIKYSITSQGASSIVNITCSKYLSGHPFTFGMTQDGNNWKISSIIE